MTKMYQKFVVLGTILLAGSLAAQDFPPQDNGGRGGERGERGERGGRGGRMWRGGGDMGNRGPGMGGMNMMDPRKTAEEELAKKAPEDFAALAKETEELNAKYLALEEKYQALAKKNEVTLPMSFQIRSMKMAAFNKKYEKELKELKELQKTDMKAYFTKYNELLKKEGLDFGPRFGGQRRGDDEMMPPPPQGGRENKIEQTKEQLKKAYPEEYAEYEKLEKAGDRDAARAKLRELFRKQQAAAHPEQK